MGDIHKYSSSAIETVSIEKGEEKPLKITVEMTASVGFSRWRKYSWERSWQAQ